MHEASLFCAVMSKIRILSDQLANRIAAGEVIERPVAVVKELLDNSIDAGAGRVSIDFQQGGKSLVVVEDDGCGMSQEDALLCIERHATSKIRCSEDLFNIQTLGFRGEAIPSIASVSRFLLRTRPADAAEGTEILINGGKLLHCRAIGMPVGTRVEVTHLFASIPARRKFLKTDETEASHIVQWVRLMAMAHPGVALRLQSGGRTLLNLPSSQVFRERVLSLWGRQLDSDLLPIELESQGLHLEGFIGKAGVSRPSRHEIITVVNGRPVDSRALSYAFSEAYHTLIAKGRYPLAMVHLKVDPASIDVNIHPSKREIKFRSESAVRSLVIHGVSRLLRGDRLPDRLPVGSPDAAGFSAGNPGEGLQAGRVECSPALLVPRVLPPAAEGPRRSDAERVLPSVPVFVPLRSAEAAPLYPSGMVPRTELPPPLPPAPVPTGPVLSVPAPRRRVEPLSLVLLEREWRFIGDYRQHHSLFERSDGLTLVHNTRARRRVAFEAFRLALDAGDFAVQADVVPMTFELDFQASRRLKGLLEKLALVGVGVEEFGRNCFRLEALPAFLSPDAALQWVMDLARGEEQGELPVDRLKDELALIYSEGQSARLELPLPRLPAFSLLGELLCCLHPEVDPRGDWVIQHLPHRLIEQRRL
jgi:DNA mismatch repair protein MutL